MDMPYAISPGKRSKNRPPFFDLTLPTRDVLKTITPLRSRGNRDLQLTFEDQLNALILYHLEEYESGRHLLQVFKEDDFVREHITTTSGIEKSSFFEAINNRGLEQLLEVFTGVCKKAQDILPNEYEDLGDLTLIDGSLIDATLSMQWADYRKGLQKGQSTFRFRPESFHTL